jgi:hypothetical protein
LRDAEAEFHWPPTRAAASKITGSNPWARSHRPAARPPGPAPMIATEFSGMMLVCFSCMDLLLGL